MINVANGELWLRDDGTVKIRPHDRKTGMRHVLPVDYDPNAKCPEYDKALQQIFRDAEKPGTVIRFLYIDDDIKAGTKLPDGTLKKISKAKTLTGERKFKDQFEFKSHAFPILLCNNIPSLADLSHGMMRRLRVVPFTRIFKEHETDRQLFERIAAKELSGVLNRALEGWKRLQTKRSLHEIYRLGQCPERAAGSRQSSAGVHR